MEKVFRFLDRWGLINYGVKKYEEEARSPATVAIVEMPSPVTVALAEAADGSGEGGCGVESLPALSSYSDVFGNSIAMNGSICGVCGDQCDSECGESLKVVHLSTVAGPHAAAAAAEAAVAALCHEKAFEIDEDEYIEDEMESNLGFEDQGMKRLNQTENIEGFSLEENTDASKFRIGAAIATSFGTVVARAKLFADQEVRDMELLIASIIEMQLKKMEIKMKHFDELELIMAKEYSQIQQLKELILEEWVSILQ